MTYFIKWNADLDQHTVNLQVLWLYYILVTKAFYCHVSIHLMTPSDTI